MEPQTNNNFGQPQAPAPGPMPQNSNYEQPAYQQPANLQAAEENPNKNYLVALLLSYFLGSIGADRFYLGKIGTGIAKLVTFGGLGIWHLVDMLLVAFNKLHEKGDDRALEGYAKNRSWVKILAIILLVFNVVVIGGLIVLMVLLSANSLQKNAQDTSRKIDLQTVAVQLSEYQTQGQGKLPTDQEFSDSFSVSDLSTLQKSDIDYAAQPEGCDNIEVNCRTFKLSTRLADGTTYSTAQ